MCHIYIQQFLQFTFPLFTTPWHIIQLNYTFWILVNQFLTMYAPCSDISVNGYIRISCPFIHSFSEPFDLFPGPADCSLFQSFRCEAGTSPGWGPAHRRTHTRPQKHTLIHTIYGPFRFTNQPSHRPLQHYYPVQVFILIFIIEITAGNKFLVFSSIFFFSLILYNTVQYIDLETHT